MGGSGSSKSGSIKFEPGFRSVVFVARGHARLYLSEHKGDARPDTLIHLYVDDIEAVSEEFATAIDDARGMAHQRS
jgi:hypothetical protein